MGAFFACACVRLSISRSAKAWVCSCAVLCQASEAPAGATAHRHLPYSCPTPRRDPARLCAPAAHTTYVRMRTHLAGPGRRTPCRAKAHTRPRGRQLPAQAHAMRIQPRQQAGAPQLPGHLRDACGGHGPVGGTHVRVLAQKSLCTRVRVFACVGTCAYVWQCICNARAHACAYAVGQMCKMPWNIHGMSVLVVHALAAMQKGERSDGLLPQPSAVLKASRSFLRATLKVAAPKLCACIRAW